MKYPVRHIVFEVTRHCNLECLYCYNYWRRDSSAPIKSSFSIITRTLSRILREIEFEHITFTGGEPFLADGLKEHILKCRLKGKGVNLISNGTSGTSGDYDILKDIGLSLIEFPLHSDIPEKHDTLTGCAGSFHKVLRSIQYCLKKSIDLCVVFVLTKINVDRLRQTLLFAEQLGIARFMIARFNIGGRGIEHCRELLPSLAELRTAFKEANEFAGRRYMKISANVCVPFCVINPQDFPDITISSCGSNPDAMPVTIDFMGNVRMCNHSPRVMGNIFKTPVSTIFSSEYINEWISARPEFCSQCNYWLRCKGGCKAASEQMGHSLYDEDPIIKLLDDKLWAEEGLQEGPGVTDQVQVEI